MSPNKKKTCAGYRDEQGKALRRAHGGPGGVGCSEGNVITGIVVGSVVTIVGAIVGAISTHIAGLKMQRESWRREDQVASRTHAIEVNRAARLIEEELVRAHAAAAICVNQQKWWSSDMQLTTEAWENYKATIATELSYTDWHALSSAVLAVQGLSRIRGNQTGDISAELAEQIVPTLTDIEAARRSLAPLTQDTLPTSVVARREESSSEDSGDS